MRLVLFVAVVLMMAPFISAGAILHSNPVSEQLVEGHSVFSVIEVTSGTTNETERFGAAVAVLIRELHTERTTMRFPGVLWFNDQYLVAPEASNEANTVVRYPCGAVIVVNQGDPVPYNSTNGYPIVPANATYNESYYITDPNERSWIIDKWTWQDRPLWSVPTGTGTGSGNPRDTHPPDSTIQCGSVTNSGNSGCFFPFVGDTPQEGPIFEEDETYNDSSTQLDSYDPNDPHEGRMRVDRNTPVCAGGTYGSAASRGDQSPTPYNFPCGTTAARCTSLRYNAVLFFFLDDLDIPGANKNHTKGSTDYNSDVSACAEYSGTAWPCPDGDDNREGNSHPYTPMRALDPDRPDSTAGGDYPFYVAEGRGNHGGSCDVAAGDVQGTNAEDGDSNCHGTRNVDIYFGYREAPTPTPRNFVVNDFEGGTAPYHCHEGMTCNEEDVSSDL